MVGYSVRMRVQLGELKVDEDDLVIHGDKVCFILKSHMHYKYYGILVSGKRQYLHRVIMKCPTGFVVDHINGDTTDNRRENLRICLNSSNSINSRKQSNGITSKYKGVSFYQRDQTWEVAVGKRYIGRYKTEREAAQIYNLWAKATFGQFANLNVIED